VRTLPSFWICGPLPERTLGLGHLPSLRTRTRLHGATATAHAHTLLAWRSRALRAKKREEEEKEEKKRKEEEEKKKVTADIMPLYRANHLHLWWTHDPIVSAAPYAAACAPQRALSAGCCRTRQTLRVYGIRAARAACAQHLHAARAPRCAYAFCRALPSCALRAPAVRAILRSHAFTAKTFNALLVRRCCVGAQHRRLLQNKTPASACDIHAITFEPQHSISTLILVRISTLPHSCRSRCTSFLLWHNTSSLT